MPDPNARSLTPDPREPGQGNGGTRGNNKHTIHAVAAAEAGPHWPPDCPRCKGFGYIHAPQRYADEAPLWVPCPDCLEHPGHTMTHLDWAIIRER